MFNKFKNGNLALNRHGNPHFAINFRKTRVPLAKSSQTAVLNKVRHPTIDDFYGCHLVGDAVAAQPYSSRRAFAQSLSQLPWSNVGFVVLPALAAGGGRIRCLRKTLRSICWLLRSLRSGRIVGIISHGLATGITASILVISILAGILDTVGLIGPCLVALIIRDWVWHVGTIGGFDERRTGF